MAAIGSCLLQKVLHRNRCVEFWHSHVVGLMLFYPFLDLVTLLALTVFQMLLQGICHVLRIQAVP